MDHPPPAPSPTPIRADATLAALAASWAGASRVFQRHGLDFCCHGQQTVASACAKRGLDQAVILAELHHELRLPDPDNAWHELPQSHLLARLVDHYHAGHRRELPRLAALAEKVEHVHRDKPDCPSGLAAFVRDLATRLDLHMAKEERVLFPLLLAGESSPAAPIACMIQDHDEHGHDLEHLRELADDFVPPAEACGTWRALYLGLAEFERELMEHIHLENHVLFPRALHGA